MEISKLQAGACTVEITPETSHFLFGYPHVERMSSGVHDALLCSALYMADGTTGVIVISCDVIYVDKALVARIRKGISGKTGVPASHILVTATHTHSGPVTVDVAISENDPVVPKADKKYRHFLEARAVEAGCSAFENAEPVEIGFVKGDATGVGTNRHDPEGAKNMEVPMMLVRNRNGEPIACLLVCSMHPTVLHEDSTLYSSDFPHYVRTSLQRHLGNRCTVVYCTGTAGNQSPRHVTKGNTFAEAERLGAIVAGSLLSKISEGIPYLSEATVQSARALVELPGRSFPEAAWARQNRDRARARFDTLRKEGGSSQEVRTAEVDWFGSEELFFLCSQSASGSLENAYASSLPAEIQAVRIGEWTFVAWPGEVFVEYGLALKKEVENSFLITYANGELQGYLVTREADEKNFYEAGNSFFHYSAGEIMLEKTVELINGMER